MTMSVVLSELRLQLRFLVSKSTPSCLLFLQTGLKLLLLLSHLSQFRSQLLILALLVPVACR